jgi:hypothetical protein
MQTPTPASTLNGNTATFIWSNDPGATSYWVDFSAENPGGMTSINRAASATFCN